MVHKQLRGKGLLRKCTSDSVQNIIRKRLCLNNIIYEGTFREKYFKSGRFYDSIQYAVIKKIGNKIKYSLQGTTQGNAAHINEDEYFRHVVHDDMDGIIKSIKETHRKDSTSAQETDFVRKLKQDLEFVSSIDGSAQKKQAALYCRRLGIDYTKLTDEEFEVMMEVLQKSKHLKSTGKKKGRKKRR